MPKLKIRDFGEFDVPEGKRLVLAIEDSGMDILHRCGGYARCTTCRIKYFEGEPEKMTVAEYKKLVEQGNLGKFRLSCQAYCTHDMEVAPLSTLKSSGLDDPGNRPLDHITPEPVEWTDAPRS